jgi:hypothetical protein
MAAHPLVKCQFELSFKMMNFIIGIRPPVLKFEHVCRLSATLLSGLAKSRKGFVFISQVIFITGQHRTLEKRVVMFEIPKG